MPHWTALHAFRPIQPCMASASCGVDYREEPPSPGLAGIVECFWELRAAADAAPFTCLGVPDGCIDWVFNSNGVGAGLTALLAASVRIPVTPGRVSFGVRFLPAALNAVAGEPLGDVYDRRLRLRDLRGADLAELDERLFESAGFRAKKALLERWLCARLARSRYEPPAGLLSCLDRIYDTRGNIGVSQLARHEGVSERQLHRLFRAELGLAPKVFARVVRFQHTLRGLAGARRAEVLALALDAGYYDQAHFLHEFRALCGTTPAALVREYPQLAQR